VVGHRQRGAVVQVPAARRCLRRQRGRPVR
jgi:hypothetical protein